jgi:hypothetical protein
VSEQLPEEPENAGPEVHYVYDSDRCTAEDGEPPAGQLDVSQGKG